MSLGITALGSGSGGNSFVVHSTEGNILIDAGFSRKELIRRLLEVKVQPSSIRAVLLSHEHDDHLRGCRVFCDQFDIPLCVSFETWNYLRRQKQEKLPANIRQFLPGDKLEFAGMTILPFTVQHDAIDPVGFVISHRGRQIGFASDLGAVNGLAEMRLNDCDILVLEANYDREMLRRSDRQPYLKQRIAGPHGHLDNWDAVEALNRLLTERTKVLLLVHVSSECNDYELIRTLARAQLDKMRREDITMQVIEQHRTFETIFLDQSPR
ncbi:MAG: MBL fold metallo-hydrolase [Victivallaceae bacterium]|nr:MBL fold metallo-hydrolase [Victivallaceae bacterium]